MSSVFQQTVSQYEQFDDLVGQYRDILQNNPSGLADQGAPIAAQIQAIAVDGTASGFSLIEKTSWMIQFGQAFITRVNAVIHSQTTSAFTGGISGNQITVVDQNNNPITLKSWDNGTVTSISFTVIGKDPTGRYSYNWDVPAGCDLSQAQEQDVPGYADEWDNKAKFTLSGDAMKAFIAQAQADGAFAFGGNSAPELIKLLASCR